MGEVLSEPLVSLGQQNVLFDFCTIGLNLIHNHCWVALGHTLDRLCSHSTYLQKTPSDLCVCACVSFVALIKTFHITLPHILTSQCPRDQNSSDVTHPHGCTRNDSWLGVGGCKLDSGSDPGQSWAVLTGADAFWQLGWMLHSSTVIREMSALSRCIRLWCQGLWKCQWAARHRKTLLMGQNVTALSYRSLTSILPNAYCMGSPQLSTSVLSTGFTESQMPTVDVQVSFLR